jgi:multiple sugar transport system permease protein
MYWLISAALRDADFTTAGTNPRVMFNMQIAASAIVTIPLIVVFLLLRKYIMSGVGRSGTKG